MIAFSLLVQFQNHQMFNHILYDANYSSTLIVLLYVAEGFAIIHPM